MRCQRLSLVSDAGGLITLDLAAVPEVALVAAERGLVAGDQNMVGRLLLASPGRGDDPAQPGLRSIDPQRVSAVFAPQPDGRQTVLFDGGERRAQGAEASRSHPLNEGDAQKMVSKFRVVIAAAPPVVVRNSGRSGAARHRCDVEYE